jgi:hypothetical protein
MQAEDCYVASFGQSFPKAMPDVLTYVLRYFSSSLNLLQPTAKLQSFRSYRENLLIQEHLENSTRIGNLRFELHEYARRPSVPIALEPETVQLCAKTVPTYRASSSDSPIHTD